jgi:hypothetical protein
VPVLVLALILRVKPNEITLPISAWLLWCLIQFIYKQAFVGSDMDATFSMQTFLKLASNNKLELKQKKRETICKPHKWNANWNKF